MFGNKILKPLIHTGPNWKDSADVHCTHCVKKTRDGTLHAKGLVPTVFSPFDKDGKLDVNVIPDYAQYLHKNNVNGVMVGGTSSEGPALSLEERKTLLDAWIKAATPLELNVVMQVGGMPMPEVLELARYCESAGPDAILTLPELYYKPKTVNDLVKYVKKVSDAAPSLPVMFYDHPSLSGVTVDLPKFFAQATKDIQNFKGIKCGFISAIEICSAVSLADDQRIFMANHIPAASAYMMGYNSSMSAITNLFPATFLDIERAIRENDVKLASSLQIRLNQRVNGIIEHGAYVPFVKAAFELISGVKVGNVRSPLPQVSLEHKNMLKQSISKMM